MLIVGWLAAFPAAARENFPDKNRPDREAVEKTENLVAEIIQKSYPELNTAPIKVRLFESDSNYFKSGFSIGRYLICQKMRYLIYVNPQVFARTAPDTGIRAIIAHELAHILYYRRKNRLELLGLVSLTDRSFTAGFERRADLEAIRRGYGSGLQDYRRWLYRNIPANKLKAKQRDYFSPDEIDRILRISEKKPEMFDVWKKDIPRNIGEIR